MFFIKIYTQKNKTLRSAAKFLVINGEGCNNTGQQCFCLVKMSFKGKKKSSLFDFLLFLFFITKISRGCFMCFMKVAESFTLVLHHVLPTLYEVHTLLVSFLFDKLFRLCVDSSVNHSGQRFLYIEMLNSSY